MTTRSATRSPKAPSSGQLSGSGANLVYVPDGGFTGGDSFQFTVTDTATGLVSSPATVTITVLPSVPVAFGQSLRTGEGIDQIIALGSTDPNGDPLTYTIVTPPADGQLSGSGANLTYAPQANFSGSDSFQFIVTDIISGDASNTATVTIVVIPPPVATSQSVTVDEGIAKAISLSSTDPNGDTLIYTIVTPPVDGQLTGAGADMTYSPNSHSSRWDSFQFTVTDTATGLVSSPANVSIAVVTLPDLQVTAVSGPANGFTLQAVLVNWTDQNNGAGSVTGPRTDNIYAATDPEGDNPTLLGSFTVNQTLAPGPSAEFSQQFTLPQAAGADRPLVITNATQSVMETNLSNDTTVATSPINVAASLLPDLVVSSISAPTSAVFSGATISISFVVTNQGTAPTSVPVWQDAVILSKDSTLAQGYNMNLIEDARGASCGWPASRRHPF